MRKLVEQRQRNAAKVRAGDDQISSGALVRAYHHEVARQKLLARKAELAEARLDFIVNTLKVLLSERMFLTLLREEKLQPAFNDFAPDGVLGGIMTLKRIKAAFEQELAVLPLAALLPEDIVFENEPSLPAASITRSGIELLSVLPPVEQAAELKAYFEKQDWKEVTLEWV
jgi:hypothetical protein